MLYEGTYIEVDEDGDFFLILHLDSGDGRGPIRDDRMKIGRYPSGVRVKLGVCLTDAANEDYELAYEAAEAYFDTVFVR